ncbi:MAG: hypothetical protein ACMXYG_03750 [Candidatus Woesearchaeota archaeon]
MNLEQRLKKQTHNRAYYLGEDEGKPKQYFTNLGIRDNQPQIIIEIGAYPEISNIDERPRNEYMTIDSISESQKDSIDNIILGVRVNNAFAKPLFDNINAMFHSNIMQYANEKDLQELGKMLDNSIYKVKNYFEQVRKAQKGKLKFNISGDSNNIEYCMNIDENNKLTVRFSKEEEAQIEISNNGRSVKYDIAEYGEIFPRYNSNLNENQALQVFEAYKPFLIEIEKINQPFDTKKNDLDKYQDSLMIPLIIEARVPEQKKESLYLSGGNLR